MNNELNKMVKQLVDYAWNNKLSGQKVNLFVANNGQYFIGTDEQCRKNNLDPQKAFVRIQGGISSVSLISVSLSELCRGLDAKKMRYLWNVLVSNQVVAPNMKPQNVRVNQAIEAFVAACFPDVLTNFYNTVVKQAKFNHIMQSLKANQAKTAVTE